ncbi:MAG: hypothetical protein ACLVBP_02605 [Ruminococcus sp.]
MEIAVYKSHLTRWKKLIREKGTAAYRISDRGERMTREDRKQMLSRNLWSMPERREVIHADHYYAATAYRRLAYKIVGITDKGNCGRISSWMVCPMVEHLIAHTLRTGMAAGRGYKDIYLDCKHRLESMKYLQRTA